MTKVLCKSYHCLNNIKGACQANKIMYVDQKCKSFVVAKSMMNSTCCVKREKGALKKKTVEMLK